MRQPFGLAAEDSGRLDIKPAKFTDGFRHPVFLFAKVDF
jgi:hypothetical protein